MQHVLISYLNSNHNVYMLIADCINTRKKLLNLKKTPAAMQFYLTISVSNAKTH